MHIDIYPRRRDSHHAARLAQPNTPLVNNQTRGLECGGAWLLHHPGPPPPPPTAVPKKLPLPAPSPP
jgi:hypothetical protein